MNRLSEVLGEQAARSSPTPDLAGVYRRAHLRQRRGRIARTSLVVFAGLGMIAALAGLAVLRSPETSPTISPPIPIETLGALAIDGPPDSPATLERRNPSADTGPRSVVVRRDDGDLGFASAVVTYLSGETEPTDSTVVTDPSSGITTVSVLRPGGRVVVRGTSLSDEELVAIAVATTIESGQPVVIISPSLESFAVVADSPTSPPRIRQVRYGCESLGEPSLGGLCYTGLASSAGFENALYKSGFEQGPRVHDQPSVLSSVGGGNATLAWELQPGVIVFVGYSGTELGEEQVAALGRLADRATLISPDEWSATQPQIVIQANHW